MRRAIAIVLLIVTVGAGGWAWTHRAPPKLTGGIVLRSLHCGSSTGVAHVSALATNDSNRTLRGLIARVTVGHGSTIQTHAVTFDSVLRGGAIEVQKDIPQPEEINVCYVKFWWNGAQVPTAFRP